MVWMRITSPIYISGYSLRPSSPVYGALAKSAILTIVKRANLTFHTPRPKCLNWATLQIPGHSSEGHSSDPRPRPKPHRRLPILQARTTPRPNRRLLILKAMAASTSPHSPDHGHIDVSSFSRPWPRRRLLILQSMATQRPRRHPLILQTMATSTSPPWPRRRPLILQSMATSTSPHSPVHGHIDVPNNARSMRRQLRLLIVRHAKAKASSMQE